MNGQHPPFHLCLRLWREQFSLSEERAARLLQTMHYNIERIESDSILAHHKKTLSERWTHVANTMSKNRCVIGKVTLKCLNVSTN